MWCAAAIYMLRTLMQSHRIIASLVNYTLDNDLWLDSRSGHFTQLRT